MTLKEKMMEIYPEFTDENAKCGVKGCTKDYKKLNVKDVGCQSFIGRVKNCTECWNREYVEPEGKNMTEERAKLEERMEELCDKFDYCENCPLNGDDDSCECWDNKVSVDEMRDRINCMENAINAKQAEHEPEKKTEAHTSNIDHPSHYCQGGIECIDAIKAAVTGLSGFEGFCAGNALKYLWRWKHKNGVECLKKAQWYIDRLIEEVNE